MIGVNRHRDLGISDELVLSIFQTSLLARRLDERLWLLNRAGKIPFSISCQGHEVAQVALAHHFEVTRDYAFPYYRDLGTVLTFGMTPKEILLSAFAKAQDPASGGRQMPSHFGHKKKHIVTSSSPVTTQFLHAAGFGLASKLERRFFVNYVSCGEGSSNQGDFHEALNFASVHQLPVLFVVQNNGYAISVGKENQYACEKISDRAVGYGMEGITIDGSDPLLVYQKTKEAYEKAKRGEGPTLIELMVTRLTPHSTDDDDSYREKEMITELKTTDSLSKFQEYLLSVGLLTTSKLESLEQTIKTIINEATDYAENAPYPAVETLTDHVYEKLVGGDQ